MRGRGAAVSVNGFPTVTARGAEPFITIGALLARVKVSRRTLYTWMQKGLRAVEQKCCLHRATSLSSRDSSYSSAIGFVTR